AAANDDQVATPAAEPPVLLYGWTHEAGRALAVVLAAEGIPARAVGAIEVLRCGPEDVVFAPLPSICAILPQGQRFHARLIVAGKSPEADLPKAHAVGARGFVVAPLDMA